MTTAAPDVWESRYIVPALPARFRPSVMARSYELVAADVQEPDAYLIAPSPDFNVKLRDRTNTVKVKVRVERAARGLERWRTTIDDRLPMDAAAWHGVLATFGLDASDIRLSAVTSTEQALRLLQVSSRVPTVRLDKTRWLFRDGDSRIDVVCFTMLGRRFGSLGIESADPISVRRTCERLRVGGLGGPRNYTELFAQAEHEPSVE